jgi:hypothetical protein
MKTYLTVIICLAVLSLDLLAQNARDEKIYAFYDLSKPPSFPGGEAEMLKYIYPKLPTSFAIPKESLTGTKVLITFVVDTLGKLSDFQILKDVGGGYGTEVVRIFKSMPAWIPGEYEGRPVKTRFSFPITVDFH